MGNYMKNHAVHFSSKTDNWATPQDFFNKMEILYGKFDLDVCADKNNAKCEKFYTIDDDGLNQEWNGKCWMNPPYGRTIGKWVKKAAECGSEVVALLPARTDTRWFHDYINSNSNAEVTFIKGRLKFGDSKNSAPFPSMVVRFKATK